MRKTIWSYVGEQYPCLINLAADIAKGVDPHSSHGGKTLSQMTDKKTCELCFGQRCPNPINYLANGEAPLTAPLGLAGRLKVNIEGSCTCLTHSPPSSLIFNGCNFINLKPLAQAKGLRGSPSDEHLRGFNIPGGDTGLSILFGPWSDFCLWCWSQYPNSEAQPILILAKDYYPFSYEKAIAGTDWGVERVNEILSHKAKDRASLKLFGAFKNKAKARFGSEQEWIRYIGENRIFIYNVWPWFRCGQKTTGNSGIHSDFSKLPCLWKWVDRLIDCLRPAKIAALGSWSYDTNLSKPDEWLRKQSSVLRHFQGHINMFRHPSAPAWPRPWTKPTAWTNHGKHTGNKKNNEAFEDFLG